jgi:hypothetical protein
MALPKKGFRTIVVDGNQFLWKIRKKVSWNEIHNSPLSIPIQHVNGGQLLMVFIGYSRSYFESNNEFPITPSIIEKCIKKGIESGWSYNENRPKFELNCSEFVKE